MQKLNPDERLLIESGINHYKLIGPGLIWLKPWEKSLLKLYIGTQSQSLQFDQVRTGENIPVAIKTEILYQTDPALFTQELLPKIPWLHKGIWQYILKWRTEHLLRQMLTSYTWSELGRAETQPRLERRLSQTLSEYLKVVGLKVVALYLVKIELPGNLQQTIIQAEQDGLEPRGRALVLKEYFKIFGQDLGRVMPFIVQWELLNTLHKNGNTQFILSNSALAWEAQPINNGASPTTYQLPLPIFPRN
jgi:regulator of protease activity HflC (stomatin/prohibitin superfamily)